MVDQVSVCDRNMKETAIAESTARRIKVEINATPFWFAVFITPRILRFVSPAPSGLAGSRLGFAGRWSLVTHSSQVVAAPAKVITASGIGCKRLGTAWLAMR